MDDPQGFVIWCKMPIYTNCRAWPRCGFDDMILSEMNKSFLSLTLFETVSSENEFLEENEKNKTEFSFNSFQAQSYIGKRQLTEKQKFLLVCTAASSCPSRSAW